MTNRDSSTPWLDARGAARRALVSEATILREARVRRLRGYKVGNRKLWRFKCEDVDEWLMGQEEPVEYVPREAKARRIG